MGIEIQFCSECGVSISERERSSDSTESGTLLCSRCRAARRKPLPRPRPLPALSQSDKKSVNVDDSRTDPSNREVAAGCLLLVVLLAIVLAIVKACSGGGDAEDELSTRASAKQEIEAAIASLTGTHMGGPGSLRPYSGIRDELTGSEMAAQITRHILVPPPVDAIDLARILVHEFADAATNEVFERFPGEYEVYVRAYPSIEHYTGSISLTIGTLYQSGLPSSDSPPDLSINEAFLETLKLPALVRLGLSEARRRQIYSNYLVLEGALLEKLESADNEIVSHEVNALKRKVAGEVGLSFDDFKSLIEEGLTHFWPFPPED